MISTPCRMVTADTIIHTSHFPYRTSHIFFQRFIATERLPLRSGLSVWVLLYISSLQFRLLALYVRQS